MFTGIIESLGKITEIEQEGTNKKIWISSPISHELKIDQSISHNGVCLTVDALAEGAHRVTAVQETLSVSTLDSWENGNLVNLERCLPLNGRLDGHLVQGHVDATAQCTRVKDREGSWEFTFRYPAKFAPYIVEKGSISVNGISLTAFNVTRKKFTVAIIPYTFEHTNLHQLQVNDRVNIEFDLVGKYVVRGKNLNK